MRLNSKKDYSLGNDLWKSIAPETKSAEPWRRHFFAKTGLAIAKSSG
jgi:hypothetical protein